MLLQHVRESALRTECHHHVSEGRVIQIFLTEVKEGQNVRVIELSNCPGLTLEESGRFSGCSAIGGSSSFGPNYLDSYLPMEACILDEIDFTHGTASKRVQDTITII